MLLRQFSCLALLGVSSPAALFAQTVRGTVTDSATSAPVVGAVVLVLDSTGRVAGRDLAGPDGRYAVTVGRSGTFQVRTLRLGFKPVLSQPFRVEGQDVALDLAVSPIPARLETVVTQATSQCRHIDGDARSPIYDVLDQIRTALHATEMRARPTFSRALNVTMVEFERTLDASTGAVRAQSAGVRRGLTVAPWSSLSPEAIHDSGYVRTDPTGTSYFAPDVAVLLSPQFIADHCFRVAAGSDTSEIRLDFEPVPGRRRIPEIRGALFVDAPSNELRRLEFEYVNVPREIRDARAGGRVAFVRVAADMWFISGWSIRLPVLESRTINAGGAGRMRRMESRVFVAAQKENGGELALVLRGRDTLFAAPPVVVTGQVVDSARGTAVAGARVRLRATASAATTDARGAFRLTGVIPGAYTLEVSTPDLEAWAPHTRTLTVTRGNSAHLVVRAPSAALRMQAACGPTAKGAIAGRVVRRDSTPVSNVAVSVSWGDDAAASRDTTTDIHGYFRICHTPVHQTATVEVMHGGWSARPQLALPSDDRPVATVRLVVDSVPVASGVLLGRVLDATNGRPVANAVVRLDRTRRTTSSDTDGRYRFTKLDSGSDTLTIQRLGYQQARIPVRLAGGRSIERNAALPRATALDTVLVQESLLPQSFADHQRLGLGQFLTRAELAKQEHRRLSDILESSMRGISLVRYMGNQAGLVSRRGPKSLRILRNEKCFELEHTPLITCGCFPAVYLDRTAYFDGRTGEIPNINAFTPASIEAIEYYSGPSQTPAIYSNLDSACGVLVIHTRR